MRYQSHLPPDRMPDISLIIQHLTTGSEKLAEESVRQLVALKEKAVPFLLDLRDSPDPDARWWAYCALGQMHDVDTEWFFQGLHDTAPEVRESAVMALSSHPDPTAITELIKALDDNDRMVTALAGCALTRIGSEAVPSLLETLESGKAESKIQAARSLAEIRDAHAIPAFMAALENGTELVKFWAEQGLQNLGSEMIYFNTNK